MKLEITDPQLNAIFNMAEDISSMIGCAADDADGNNWDIEMAKRIKLINRFLKKNGYNSVTI